MEKHLHRMWLHPVHKFVPFSLNRVNDEVVGVLAESLHLVIDQWIQYKLGKQYL